MIAMAGEANRKIFFGDKNLGLSEGYQILLGGAPKLKDIKKKDPTDLSESNKRLLLLFRRERINEGAPTVYVSTIPILISILALPLLLEDIGSRMKDWGSEGKINPFNEVYDVSLHFLIPHVYNDLMI